MNPEKPAPEPSAEYAEAGMFAFRLDRSMHEDPYRKTIKLILDRDKDILAAKQAELDAVKAQNLALRDAVLGNGTFVCEIDPVQYAKETRECLAQARAALAECQKDRERDYSRLIELLDRVVWEMDEHADFRNGNTDPTGSIDEGLVMHARFLAPFKDLLEQSRKRIDKAIASRAIIGGDAV